VQKKSARKRPRTALGGPLAARRRRFVCRSSDANSVGQLGFAICGGVDAEGEPFPFLGQLLRITRIIYIP